jgi:hypothetical protein
MVVLVVAAGLLLMGGLRLWTYQGLAAGEAGKGKGERHPHIRRALTRLRNAKKDLLLAKPIYHGHRASAIKEVDVAIQQLEMDLKSVKK